MHWTKGDIRKLTLAYGEVESFSRETIARELNRSEASVACKAGELGLGNAKRRKSKAHCLVMSEQRKGKPSLNKGKKIWANKKHPRGMLGKHHTEASKQAMRDKLKGQKQSPGHILKRCKSACQNRGVLPWNRPRGSWKAGWRVVGGKRFYARSRWEANYARYLELLKKAGEIKEWEHEPITFWFDKIKRGTRSYLPDFRVTNNDDSTEYHEVKGWMDARSKTKAKRMAKYYPEIKVVMRDSKWFAANRIKLSGIIPTWEAGR